MNVPEKNSGSAVKESGDESPHSKFLEPTQSSRFGDSIESQ